MEQLLIREIIERKPGAPHSRGLLGAQGPVGDSELGQGPRSGRGGRQDGALGAWPEGLAGTVEEGEHPVNMTSLGAISQNTLRSLSLKCKRSGAFEHQRITCNRQSHEPQWPSPGAGLRCSDHPAL